uniref:N-myc-interactor-like isoform X3 n=1 Tax=Myxine glutinosa TaxID=7769 RepID=UPI00358DE2D9
MNLTISMLYKRPLREMEDFTVGENIPEAMNEDRGEGTAVTFVKRSLAKEKTREELGTELKEAKAELKKLNDLLHFAELKHDVEQGRLVQENQVLQAELRRIQMQLNRELGEFGISSSLPEKPLEFTEVIETLNETPVDESLAIQSNFSISTTVTYPLSSGDALITFEDEKVAQKVIAKRIHFFVVDDYRMEIKAFPIALELVQNFEINTEVSKTKILVWDIPSCFSPEQMEDKLELGFCRPTIGGGEVVSVEYTPETSTAVITFKDEGVAEKLTCQRAHTINARKDNIKVKVSPFLQGNLKNLNTYSAMSQRTVLLKDIVEVIAPDDLQDRLEIFFQKDSNGGGEVQNIVYAAKKKRVFVRFAEFSSPSMTNPKAQ